MLAIICSHFFDGSYNSNTIVEFEFPRTWNSSFINPITRKEGVCGVNGRNPSCIYYLVPILGYSCL